MPSTASSTASEPSASTDARSGDARAQLADPALRAALERFVRAKVPGPEVEDIVQTTLADALVSPKTPRDPNELKRWAYRIARHKVADFYRRARRELPQESVRCEEAPAESAPHSATDLLRWAKRELPNGEGADRALEWALREADGDKLESIAADARLPAPRVRQRVSRLRRHLRRRWAAELAAVAALLGLSVLLWSAWKHRGRHVTDQIAREPVRQLPAKERATELRRTALEACKARQWQRCLKGLNAARRLDPEGDRALSVQQARGRAAAALSPPAPSSRVAPPAPRPTHTARPTPTAVPHSVPPRRIPSRSSSMPTGSSR